MSRHKDARTTSKCGKSSSIPKRGGHPDLMPAIKIPGPYIIKFYSNENDEPAHVHVKRERKLAKFWIGPVHLESSRGFALHELQKIENLIKEHEHEIEAAWNKHFSR
jgi:hypothetical protein